ncbi:MAG TPA: bifunctional phosphoribosylaminoimidazolecarboxamide formyltransferase/IMP cyclohydrolase [Candidatus Dormibacteraeota bacterium]|nr:bifunctional phosphoribosylaminoimidazolecarboxamide formyltransferase/IMP cyclohydrolase [Candidatus Dormibacteraeota bacterium]
MSLRALLGPHDKTGLVDFARGLRECGVELVATDGTRRALAAAGIEATAVSEVTGLPEMLDGRVKTLHPAIHAGILARRDVEGHLGQLAEHGFRPIDIVAVSLYPFRETVARGASRAEVIENIDIGGPTLIRGAAKNADSVTVVVSPSQYPEVLAELRERGEVRTVTRRRLAAEAFAHVAAYDTAVAAYLAADRRDEGMPAELTVGGPRIAELRYGENPHQRGALYAVAGAAGGLARARHVQGPALSFTNWLDADAARRLVGDFAEPAAAIIKHTNPCGFAVGADAVSAYRRAHACDPRSAYGGVVALNRRLDPETAAEVTSTFLEVLVVPGIEPDAAGALARRERMRVLDVAEPSGGAQLDVRSVDGGLLVQTADTVSIDRAAMRVATRRAPTEAEWADLLVAVRVCRHVKSNAIVLVRDGMAVGVGAGQMSRVEAAELAVARAAEAASGSVAASDAFFPFPDGLEVVGRAGATAVIQPGGSKNDDAVIAAADALGMAMVLTGERHFRH